MAVLNKIRQRSVFLIIIIALALFSFVLADVIRNGGMVSQKSQNTIATINGEDIEREQFARQVEAYQRNLGPNASSMQAVNMVWDLNVRQAVLEEQFEELGIRIEEAQLKRMMRQELATNPNFTNEAGMFDENRLREYVATLKATSPAAYQQWLDFENSVGKAAREDIYFNMVRAGLSATLTEGEQVYRRSNDNVDLSFVQIPYSSVPDAEVEVSKSEIKAYMEAHPQRFQSEASRNIRYVYFAESASVEDDAEVKEEIAALLEDNEQYNPATETTETVPGFGNVEDVEAFVNQNSDINYIGRYLFRDQLSSEHAEELFNLEEGETFGPYKENNTWKVSRMMERVQIPDSAKAKHILVAYQGSPVGQGIARTKSEAEALADSIASVVRGNQEQFAELAAQYSADTSNKEEAGDLGWFTPNTMVPAFNDFVFQNNAGEIGVVETQFGYHVIHIEEQTNEQPAVKLATISRAVEPSEKSLNDLFAEVTKFEIAAGEGDFEEIAKENDKNVRPVQEIGALDENIPGVGQQRRIVQWAFEEDAEVGDIRRFDVSGGYVVAQLTAKNKKGLKSVESASATVLPILQKEKKAEIIKERISGESLSAIAQSQGVEVNTANSVNLENPTLPGAGNEPKIVGAAFGLEEGQTSQPLAGNRGVYVIEVLRKNLAAPMDSYRSFAVRETTERRANVTQEVLDALKETAEIEDNRSKFF
ncbi:peptidylprolyl isomerase [Salinimicrobium sp. GXAS 041]|uniref:peptidylprolyl isomerase n=1 Tax=Salinimicrobium sp. GXAS 041 TaxID=3400806 RepID=UPI003C76F5DD